MACCYSTYLEVSPHPERIANFVGMGSTIIQAEIPQTDMLRANQGLRAVVAGRQPGAAGPAAGVRPDPRHGHDRSVLLLQ